MGFAAAPLSLDATELNLSQTLVASISNCLSDSEIPCVLWGNFLLTVYGVPSMVNSIDFVVFDESITACVNVLSIRGLTPCANLNCPMVSKNRPSPPPSAHFHIHPVDDTITLDIYPKSTTLGFIPSLGLRSHGGNPSDDIILASDPRLPSPREGRAPGRFDTALAPVCIPSAHILTEAFIQEAATSKHFMHNHFARTMLTYIQEFVDGDGFLDTSLLEPRAREFYLAYRNDTKPIKELFADLESAFSAERELVPPVPLQPGAYDYGDN